LVSHLKIYLKGMCMGVADVIPGISGGTLALMLNIYERLIAAIKSVSPRTVLPIFKNLLIWKESHRRDLKSALLELDAFFLMTVGAGVISSFLLLSSIVPHLIVEHTAFMFACFLGLIVPSISIPWQMIKKKAANQYLSLLLGLAFTILISWLVKSNGALFGTEQSFGMVCLIFFCSALVAISAMILPGISGSFILILLGQYMLLSGLATRFKMFIFGQSFAPGEIPVRKKVALALVERFSDFEVFILIGLFGTGCLIGIVLMSKVIHIALRKSHDTTMAFLTGMICSSAYVLWPFKEGAPVGMLEAEKIKWIPKAPNIIPEMNGTTAIALGIFVVSMIFSAVMVYLGARQESSTTDI
jgi:putative membrane protein